MKKDITTPEDIKLLVDAFYVKVRKDDTIGFIFNGAMNMHWEEHFPIMYRFWETMLLNKASYRGNAMQKHLDLNKSIPLKDEYFNSWINLWELAVNENFEGPKAKEAITKANSIKEIMKVKVKQS